MVVNIFFKIFENFLDNRIFMLYNTPCKVFFFTGGIMKVPFTIPASGGIDAPPKFSKPSEEKA